MATRNANNTDFGTQFGGTTLTVFDTSSYRRRCTNCTLPTKTWKSLSRQYKSLVTFLLPGAFSGGAFKIYLEQSGWTAADPTNRNLAIGGTMASTCNRRHIIITPGIRMNNMDPDGDGKVSKWEYLLLV